MLILIKRISSVILMLAFFLPLSQCSKLEGQSPNIHSIPVDIVAYSSYDWPSIGSSVAVAVFFWPVFLQIIVTMRPKRERNNVFPMVIEVFMCLLTATGISWLTFMGNSIRYGAWIAYSANGIYGGTLLVELVRWLRIKLASRKVLRSNQTS